MPSSTNRHLRAHRRSVLTRHELEVLDAWLETGSYAAAAFRLGRSESSVAAALENARAKKGAVNGAQLVDRSGRELARFRSDRETPLKNQG